MSRGGLRLGDGRKPKPMLVVRKARAEEILAGVNEIGLWSGLLLSDDPRIRLDTLKYLTDRRDGKAPQAVNQQSDRVIVIQSSIPRPTDNSS
jgi:hypothetical protein